MRFSDIENRNRIEPSKNAIKLSGESELVVSDIPMVLRMFAKANKPIADSHYVLSPEGIISLQGIEAFVLLEFLETNYKVDQLYDLGFSARVIFESENYRILRYSKLKLGDSATL